MIGVAVATFSGGQNLNFAIPASYLALLLSDPGLPAPLSTAARSKQERSLTAGLGGRSSGGIVGSQFAWKATNVLAFYGDFSFSLRNQLREPVKEVRYLVIFYDRNGKPIETSEGTTVGEEIPPGLAKRETGWVDDSVRPLTARVDIRILDFKFAREAVTPVEPSKPQADATIEIPKPPPQQVDSPLDLPPDWTHLEGGGAVRIHVDGGYVHEQESFEGDGSYIQKGSYMCETKRQGDQWVGTCHYKLMLRWAYLVAPTWCTLELEERITSLSPHRIEGESQLWNFPSSPDKCPVPGVTREHFVLIPKF